MTIEQLRGEMKAIADKLLHPEQSLKKSAKIALIGAWKDKAQVLLSELEGKSKKAYEEDEEDEKASKKQGARNTKPQRDFFEEPERLRKVLEQLENAKTEEEKIRVIKGYYDDQAQQLERLGSTFQSSTSSSSLSPSHSLIISSSSLRNSTARADDSMEERKVEQKEVLASPPPRLGKDTDEKQSLLGDRSSRPKANFCLDVLRCFFGEFSTWRGAGQFLWRNKLSIILPAALAGLYIFDKIVASKAEYLFPRLNGDIDPYQVNATAAAHVCEPDWDNPSCHSLRDRYGELTGNLTANDNGIVSLVTWNAIMFGHRAVLTSAAEILSFVQNGGGLAITAVLAWYNATRSKSFKKILKSLVTSEQDAVGADGQKITVIDPGKSLIYTMLLPLFCYANLNLFFLDKPIPLPFAHMDDGSLMQMTLDKIKPDIDDSFRNCKLAYPDVAMWEHFLIKFGCVGAILFYNLFFSQESHTESAAKEYNPTSLLWGSVAGIYLALTVARIRQKYISFKENQAKESTDKVQNYGATTSVVSMEQQIQQSLPSSSVPSVCEKVWNAFCCMFRTGSAGQSYKAYSAVGDVNRDDVFKEATSRRCSSSSL